jgi:hypothetical protein
MITFSAAPKFDFDEWVTLYRDDPKAFEARRRALLAIETVRAGEQSAAVRRTLEELESRLDGLGEAERLQEAMRAMVESVRALTDLFAALSDRMTEHGALQEVRATGLQR